LRIELRFASNSHEAAKAREWSVGRRAERIQKAVQRVVAAVQQSPVRSALVVVRAMRFDSREESRKPAEQRQLGELRESLARAAVAKKQLPVGKQ